MKCELCNHDDRLEEISLCAVCCEALTRVAAAQSRIEAARLAELSSVPPQQTGADVNEYLKAFGR